MLALNLPSEIYAHSDANWNWADIEKYTKDKEILIFLLSSPARQSA